MQEDLAVVGLIARPTAAGGSSRLRCSAASVNSMCLQVPSVFVAKSGQEQ